MTFVSQLTILLDVGGIINDKRQQTDQWQQLVGGCFAPLLGGTSEQWSEAHRVVTKRFQDQGSPIARIGSLAELPAFLQQ
ncbi:MAG: hypothetical protein NVSMB27_30600 [Ktedonobacteraceae bacterium]